jgi:hypothetical protein
MLDQVIDLYPNVDYFHVGCDEVFYKLVHSKCENYAFKNDFGVSFIK